MQLLQNHHLILNTPQQIFINIQITQRDQNPISQRLHRHRLSVKH